MHLSIVPMTPSNLPRCSALWGARSDYTAAELSTAFGKTAWLLAQSRARGRIIHEPDGRVRGFGFTTFVRESFAASYLAAPHAQIGRRILCDRDLADITLDEGEVGRRNAGAGLELVTVNQGFDVRGNAPGIWQPLLGTMIQAFSETHRGFKLARIINEVFDPESIEILERIKPGTLHRFPFVAKTGEPVETAVWILDRGEAERGASLLLPMFTYSPPLVGFTSAEQHVLRIALSGATDVGIAAELGVTVAAIKARWKRIVDRAMAAEPGLRDQLETTCERERRGPQRRHIVVDYVRANPSELTPYDHCRLDERHPQTDPTFQLRLTSRSPARTQSAISAGPSRWPRR